MKRGTTPTHKFTLPIEPAMVSKFLLTYSQNEKVVLEKTEADMTKDGNVWSVELTQEETNLFSEGNAVCQIRILTLGGDAMASQEYLQI